MEMLLWDYKESIPGEPEIDYPILDKIPATAFTCDGRLTGESCDLIYLIRLKVSFLSGTRSAGAMQVITPMSKPVVRCSTFAPSCRKVRASRTPSCAPTEPSSTRRTLLANGDSLATFFCQHNDAFSASTADRLHFFEWRPNRWADVNCPTSDQFFKLNENIGKVPEKSPVKRQTLAETQVAAQAPEHPAAAARSSSRFIKSWH